MKKAGIPLMVLSAVCTSFGQYFWKISSGSNPLYLLAGFFLYGVGSVLMITAFRFGSFSVLHPMLSLGYAFALLIGFFFLGETVSPVKIAALLLILFGVAMIGKSDE